MPRVVITGANGFLGSYLVKFFIQKGWQVNALVHAMPQSPIAGADYQVFNLNGESNIPTADYLVHCAYAKESFELNTLGTSKLLQQSRTLIKKYIFISSISANENALSIYGKQKQACEKLFDKSTDLILRPGLILGNGGLFGQMREYLKKKNLIPLINGGTQPLQTIYIQDLAETIALSIEKNMAGTLTIASPERINYKEFYTMLCATLRTKPTFISIQYSLFYFCLSIAETIGIKLPISRENMLGLKQLKYMDTTEDLKKLEVTLKSTEESLQLISAD